MGSYIILYISTLVPVRELATCCDVTEGTDWCGLVPVVREFLHMLVSLFSYFYPCNNHQELQEKQVQGYCYWWLNPDITSIYTRRLELLGKSIFSLYEIIE